MGLGTDIDTGLPMSLSMNVYAKYQWQNYGAANENEWDGYRFKIKYFVPITDLWGGQLSYIGFTNFDWGSDLGMTAVTQSTVLRPVLITLSLPAIFFWL